MAVRFAAHAGVESKAGARLATCAICQNEILAGAELQACPECAAAYHTDCWEYNAGCAVYGCKATPHVEQRSMLEIPPAYWGEEHKACSSCGKEILAGALRCRHCGARFASASPASQDELRHSQEAAERLRVLRRDTIWLLIFGAVPFSAPFAAVVGARWAVDNRALLIKLTGVFAAMWRIGLGVAIVQTVLLVLIVALHPLLR